MAKRKHEQQSKWQRSKWRPKQKDTWFTYNTRNFQQLCAEKCRGRLRTTYALNHGANCSLCGATKADRENLGAHKYLHGAHAGISFRDMLYVALKFQVLNNVQTIITQVASVCSTFQKIHGLELKRKQCSIIKNTCSTCNPFVEKISPLKVEEYLAKGPIFWRDHMRAAAKDDATTQLFDRPNVKFKNSPICHWYTPVQTEDSFVALASGVRVARHLRAAPHVGQAVQLDQYNGVHEFYWSSHRAVHEPPPNVSSGNRSLLVAGPHLLEESAEVHQKFNQVRRILFEDPVLIKKGKHKGKLVFCEPRDGVLERLEKVKKLMPLLGSSGNGSDWHKKTNAVFKYFENKGVKHCFNRIRITNRDDRKRNERGWMRRV